MECSKCQFENPGEAKFCGKCGEKLFLVCTQCGSENTPGNNFCNECGHKLNLLPKASAQEISFDEKINRIQRYLPEGLREKILSQKDKIEGERRQVTIMFCDMKGFTPLTEKIGPDETFNLMDQVYEILIHKVNDYQGTVNELRGDGILAFFGAPIALEDAPQRAIRSALAIQREISKFNETIRRSMDIPPVLLRIGINSGPVVVGDVGNDLRVQFTAMGDTINMASRMEGLAEPGTTYVTDETYKLAKGFFRFEALGAKKVKGKDHPMQIYRVIAPSSRRTRFDVSAERGLTPFVGRERELDLLLDAFDRAKAGRGQAVSIISEAGGGKSRLLYEFRKVVTNEDVIFLEGKCLSYSRSVAYHPVIDILKANFGIQEGESDSAKKEKVRNGLKFISSDESSTLPYLLELLSVKDSGIDEIIMSPEGKRDRIIEALKAIALNGSKLKPLIMAFEDLHWMDKTSENVLKYFLEGIPGSRILLILTYRPDFDHTWSAKSYHSYITLNRLSNRETLTMVNHLLYTDLDESLQKLILEKAEGIPFFIEEFIKALVDLKIIESDGSKYTFTKDAWSIDVPSTIQDIIMARVDSLSEGGKEVLQTGSVIEREFSYGLIKQVTNFQEEDLLTHLSLLKDAELIYERGIYPESTYIFKHALTRDVVYGSILTKKVKQLHWEIGKAIEEIHKNNIDVHYGVLAWHFMESENYEKAAEYSKLAAKKAQKSASFAEAIEHGKTRVGCLEKLPKTDDVQRKIIDARAILGTYYMNLNHHIKAKDAVTPVVDLALELNYKKRLPNIYAAIGMYSYSVEEDYPKAFKYLGEAMKIAEKQVDFFGLWLANYFLGNGLGWNCEFERAFECFNKALNWSTSANNMAGIIISKGSLGLYAIMPGKIDFACRTTEETLLTANNLGDIFYLGIAYSFYGASCYAKGLLDKAETTLLKGFEYCERVKQAVWGSNACFWLGQLYTEKKEYKKAKDILEKGLAIFLEQGSLLPSWSNLIRALIFRAKALSKDTKIPFGNVSVIYERNRPKLTQGFTARIIGEILLNSNDGHMSDAEYWIRKAIESNKINGLIYYLGYDYALYAELFKRRGDLSKAKEKLNKAIEIFAECGADGWAERYEKELASLS